MKVYTGESSEEQHQAQGRRRKRSPSETDDVHPKELPETKFNISQVSPVSTNSSSNSTTTTTQKTRNRKRKSSTLYVYLYMTDKNGTYDQSLTETFISIWNISRDGGAGGGGVSGEEIGSGIIVGNMFSHKVSYQIIIITKGCQVSRKVNIMLVFRRKQTLFNVACFYD